MSAFGNFLKRRYKEVFNEEMEVDTDMINESFKAKYRKETRRKGVMARL